MIKQLIINELNKSPQLNEGLLDRITSSVLLSGMAFLYSCTVKQPPQLPQQPHKSFVTKYGLERLSNQDMQSLKSIKTVLINTVSSSNDIEDKLKSSIIHKIDSIPFYFITQKNATKLISTGKSNGGNANFIAAFNNTTYGPYLVINKDKIGQYDSSEIANVIIHELSHYVDHLDNKKHDAHNLIDHSLRTPDDMKFKIKNLVSTSFGTNTDLNNKLIQVLTNELLKNFDYYSGEDEAYVRNLNFKLWLMENKQMTDINQNISKKHIQYFLNQLTNNTNLLNVDFFSYVMLIDYDKLP